MPFIRVLVLTCLALIAFAANSLLCRLALKHTSIDAASFTTIRIVSGAAVLWLVTQLRSGTHTSAGNWISSLALLIYAAGFSYAYLSMPASVGALLLFLAVQATMVGYAIWSGERLATLQVLGLALALGGLVGLMLPGLSTPPLLGSGLMLIAGMAWGIYSLRGRGSGDPLGITAGNFLRAVPGTIVLSALTYRHATLDYAGVIYALLSGGFASGIGYAVWYSVLPALKATKAATVQLSVPVLATLGGVVFLNEAVTLRLTIATVAILGGIALIVLDKRKASTT